MGGRRQMCFWSPKSAKLLWCLLRLTGWWLSYWCLAAVVIVSGRGYELIIASFCCTWLSMFRAIMTLTMYLRKAERCNTCWMSEFHRRLIATQRLGKCLGGEGCLSKVSQTFLKSRTTISHIITICPCRKLSTIFLTRKDKNTFS